MRRNDLIQALQTVSPALATMDLIPIFTHFCFTGDNVFAYNDQIAISAPLPTDFAGAVPGKVMLDLLTSWNVDDVSMVEEPNALVIKAGRSRFTLPRQDASAFVFRMPEAPDVKDTITPVPMFLASLKHCMRSVTTDTSTPEKLGVTLLCEPDWLSLFSTNGTTLSYAGMDVPYAVSGERATLPDAFCRELLKGDDGLLVEVRDDYAIAQRGGVHVYGRLIETERPLDFPKVMRNHMHKGKMFAIPDRLKLILTRASIAAVGGASTTITCRDDGRMHFDTKSALVDASESENVPGHPPVNASVEPKHLVGAVDDFDEFIVTDKAVIMARSDSDRVFLVSVRR